MKFKLSWIKSSLGVLTLACIIAGCTRGCSSNPVVAVVGDYKIRQKDADLRDEIIRLEFPNEKRSLGLQQLVGAYTHAQILNNNGHPVNDEVIKKEAERIDRETGLPEFLARIKAVFKGDMEAYRRVYVLPVYANRTIYFGFFLHNDKVQAESLKVAQDFIAQINADPKEFSKILKERGLQSGFFTVSAYDGFDYILPGEEDHKKREAGMKIITPEKNAHLKAKFEQDQKRQQSEEAVKWINEVIKPLKPGQLYAKVIDRNESWQVVRYIGPVKGEDEKYKLEGVHFPKADYGKWFESEKAKFKVEIFKAEKPKPKESPQPAPTQESK